MHWAYRGLGGHGAFWSCKFRQRPIRKNTPDWPSVRGVGLECFAFTVARTALPHAVRVDRYPGLNWLNVRPSHGLYWCGSEENCNSYLKANVLLKIVFVVPSKHAIAHQGCRTRCSKQRLAAAGFRTPRSKRRLVDQRVSSAPFETHESVYFPVAPIRTPRSKPCEKGNDGSNDLFETMRGLVCSGAILSALYDVWELGIMCGICLSCVGALSRCGILVFCMICRELCIVCV